MKKFVVTKRPGLKSVLGICETKTIKSDTLKKAIDDQYFAVTHILVDGILVDVWCDDEGLLKNLPLNFIQDNGQPIVGPIIACAADSEGESIPLTKKLAEKTAKWLDAHSPHPL